MSHPSSTKRAVSASHRMNPFYQAYCTKYRFTGVPRGTSVSTHGSPYFYMLLRHLLEGIVSSAQGPRRAQMHKTKSGRPFSIQRPSQTGGFSQNRLGKLRRLREGSSAYLRRPLDERRTTRFRFVHLCTAWPLCTGYDPLLQTPIKEIIRGLTTIRPMILAPRPTLSRSMISTP
jgi:hypothetical protein